MMVVCTTLIYLFFIQFNAHKNCFHIVFLNGALFLNPLFLNKHEFS